MSNSLVMINEVVLIPLAILVGYYDMRYRRIPNAFVLGTLISGLVANTVCEGWGGLVNSLAGCLLAFTLMLTLRFFTGLGAGDVKLFGAIGSLLGVHLILPTFLIIILVGGLLAVITMLRAGTARQTLFGALQILAGLLPGSLLGGRMMRRPATVGSGQTIPYGIAIVCGSLISVANTMFRT